LAKIIIGVISVIVIIVSIAIAGYSVNNLVNSDEKLLQNPKVQANLLEISDAGNQILDGCMNMEASLPMLETCKTTYMPELIENCQDSIIATLELCSDPRIQEFESTIDQRIDDKRQYVAALELELTEIQKRIKELQEHKIESLEKPPSDIFEYANQSILELIDTCLARDELSQNCIDTARQILQQCALDSTVPACSDLRLLEIANYEITEQSQSSITQDGSLTIQDKNLSHENPSITSQFGTLSLSTNKITIERDDAMLEISGNVTDYKKGIPLILTIKNPNNESEILETIVTSNGYFKTYWIVKSDFTEGNYSIVASYNDNKIGSLEFDVNGQSNAEVTEQQFTLDRECEQNRVCVLPGDHITYSIETPHTVVYDDYYDVGRGTITYTFGKFVNQNDIELKFVFISEEGHEYAYSGLMDVTTGFLHDFPDDANRIPIGGIRIVPFMVENISSVSALSDNDREFVVYEDEHATGWYNGQQPYRNTIFVKTDDYPQIDVRIDKETKIIIFSSITAYGGYIMLHTVLTDTNIL